MAHISFRPAVVSACGCAARQSGSDVRVAKRKVVAAEEDAACVFASGLATKAASDRFTDAVETGVGAVADALTGTGDKLLTTASLVRSTDDTSTDLFLPWTARPR